MSGLWDAAQLWPCVNVTESCDFRNRSLVGLFSWPTQTVQKWTGSIWRYELFSIWPFLLSAVALFHINGPCLQCLCLYTLSGVELSWVRHHCHLHLAASASQVYHQSDTNTNTVNHTARRLTIAPLTSRPPAAQQCRVSTGRRTCTPWVRDWTSWEAEWDFIW